MEYFDVVDETGTPTGEIVERSQAHREGILHRTAHLWITRIRDGKVQILLQKRAMDKDSFPDCWDTSSAGHIPAGQEPEDSCLRELQEELGITAEKKDLERIGTLKVGFEMVFHEEPFRDREVVSLFHLNKDVDLKDVHVQKEEIDTAEWFDLAKVYKDIVHHDERYCIMKESLELLAEHLHADLEGK